MSSRATFKQCGRRTDTSTMPDAPERCRAGMPHKGNRASTALCEQRQQCALHQRWVREDLGFHQAPADARVLGMPRMPGRPCHYFKVMRT